MGYDTNLIFVNGYNKKGGFMRIEASAEMGCICNNAIAKLIGKHKLSNDKKISTLLKEYRKCKEMIKDNNIYLVDKERKELNDKISELSIKLDKYLPNIYWDDSIPCYEDTYGDPLIIVDLEELKEAIILDQAKARLEKFDFRRYDMALRLIDHFLNTKYWLKDEIKVIMWGH